MKHEIINEEIESAEEFSDDFDNLEDYHSDNEVEDFEDDFEEVKD